MSSSDFPTVVASANAMQATRIHWLYTLDSRLKIALATLFGVLTWHVQPAVLGVYGVCLWVLCARSSFFTRAYRSVITAYGMFIVFWGALKLGLECFSISPEWQVTLYTAQPQLLEAAYGAGLLMLQLSILIGLGLILALTTSPRQLGLALSWYLRPFLGRHAWQTALSLALMIHFLPLTQQTFAQVKQAMMLRQPKRSRWQRFLLVLQATLRILAQKTWTQTIAVAARGLDTSEAWEPEFSPQPLAWCVGLVLAIAGLYSLSF